MKKAVSRHASHRALASTSLIASCLLLLAPAAGAQTITVNCHGQDEAGKSYALTLAYDGGESGTLKIGGTFGTMSMRAAKRHKESVVAGETINATQVWGGAEIPLVVPEQAAIEACVKGKLPPDQVTDADVVFITIPSCAASAQPTAQPIPVKVYADFTFLDRETVWLTFKRTYLEKTTLPEGTLTLELLPPPECTVD